MYERCIAASLLLVGGSGFLPIMEVYYRSGPHSYRIYSASERLKSVGVLLPARAEVLSGAVFLLMFLGIHISPSLTCPPDIISVRNMVIQKFVECFGSLKPRVYTDSPGISFVWFSRF